MTEVDLTHTAKTRALRAINASRVGDHERAKEHYLEAALALAAVSDVTKNKSNKKIALETAAEYLTEAERLGGVINRQRGRNGEDTGRRSRVLVEETEECVEEVREVADEDEATRHERMDVDDVAPGEDVDSVAPRASGDDASKVDGIAPDEFVSSACLDDLIGLDRPKEILDSKLGMYARFPNLFEPSGSIKRATGMLLYGPPGTGKTQLVKAISNKYNCVLFSVTPASVVSKWVGESARNLKQVFDKAFQYARSDASAVPIIFIDEVDCLAARRDSSDSESSRQLMAQLLVLMTQCSTPETPVTVIGASNRPWDIDDAIMRRFQEQIYAGLPNKNDRETILRAQISKLDSKLTPEDYEYAADITEMYSGSDLCSLTASIHHRIIMRLKDSTHMKAVLQEDGTLRMQPCSPDDPDAKAIAAMTTDRPEDVIAPPVQAIDVRMAIRERRPTANAALLEKYTEWQARQVR